MTDATDDVDWYDGDECEVSDDLLTEAVGWAYHKLSAYGLGQDGRSTLMMDRLKLFLENGDMW